MRRVLVMAALLATTSAAHGDCPITRTNTESLYAALKGYQDAEGCTLENVATDHDTMIVIFARHGRPQPTVLVRSSECAEPGSIVGPALSMTSPPSECHLAMAEMAKLIQRESFGGAAPPTDPDSVRISRQRFAAAGLVVAAALALPSFIGWRRRRRS